MSLVVYPILRAKPGQVKDIVNALPLQDCLSNQPGTFAYYFFEPSQEEDQIQAIEVYEDSAALKAHGTSDSFKEFSTATRSFFAKGLVLQQARPSCGFLTKGTESASQLKPTDNPGDIIAVLVRVYCHSAEARNKVLALAKEICEKVEQEAGTLSYHWGADLKDDTQIIVFERYTNFAAIYAHKEAPYAPEFLRDTKSLVKSMTVVFGSPLCGYLKKNPSLMESSKL